MSNPRSLDYMAACIRDVTHLAQNDDVTAGLHAAVRTLEWMAKGEAALKVLIALREERPELFEAMREIVRVFPEAQISRVGMREPAE